MNVQRNLEPGKVTICIVNYKTEELTRLCLRSLRKFTTFPYTVVVVDNDSNDASLDYLRSLKWITLIERPGEVPMSGSWAHGTGLDLGLAATDTEYFMAMHSDTFVHREKWLEWLIAFMQNDPGMACVGGGKLELKPAWQMFLKKYTDYKLWLKNLNPNKKRDDFYIRTICALYKTETLLKENLTFNMKVDEGVTCGKQLYYELIDKNYKTRIIEPYDMSKYLYHLAHATMVLNPEFTVRKHTEKKCRKALMELLNSPLAKEILNDKSLDS
jgi:glycosyltransferase involved in cell wall biosynthesis